MPSRSAVRVDELGRTVFLMPYADAGQRVVFEQDPETFQTTQRTVSDARARELARAGRQVPLWTTPAWCDPAAPAAAETSHSTT